jgi:hypothetical protein
MGCSERGTKKGRLLDGAIAKAGTKKPFAAAASPTEMGKPPGCEEPTPKRLTLSTED